MSYALCTVWWSAILQLPSSLLLPPLVGMAAQPHFDDVYPDPLGSYRPGGARGRRHGRGASRTQGLWQSTPSRCGALLPYLYGLPLGPQVDCDDRVGAVPLCPASLGLA